MLNVGDRVIGVSSYQGGQYGSLMGTVLARDSYNKRRVAIRFDERFTGGHELMTAEGILCERGFGWFIPDVDEKYVRLIKPVDVGDMEDDL